MADGLFVKLTTSYYEDERILEVGQTAELLYVRALCLAKRLNHDGVIGRNQLRRILPDDCPDGAPDDEAVEALIAVGLWAEVDGGYKITAWEEHNPTADEIRAMRDGSAMGNHVRWHKNRGKKDRSCEFCYPGESAAQTPGDPDLSPPDSPPDSPTECEGIAEATANPILEKEIETEEEIEDKDLAATSSQRKPRPPDLLFEAIAAECGIDISQLTKTARGGLNSARSQLAAIGADPAEVQQRASKYRSTYPGISLTPSALVKHWPALNGHGPGPAPPVTNRSDQIAGAASLGGSRWELDEDDAFREFDRVYRGDEELITAAKSAYLRANGVPGE